MEQSRHLYENATNQLGSFLQLVSTQLTLEKPKVELNEKEETTPRRRSRSSLSEKDKTVPRKISANTKQQESVSNKSWNKSKVEHSNVPSYRPRDACICQEESGRI